MTPMAQNRRHFLATLTAAGAAGLLGGPSSKAQDGRLETTTVRIGRAAHCIAPQFVADELLRAEGFTDIHHAANASGTQAVLALARGDIDFTASFSPPLIISIDAGEPITIVAGEHVGCMELFARESIRSISDLKGKTVGVQGDLPQSPFMNLMASYVGLDPAKDIRWVTGPSPKPMDLFAEGKIDAFLGNPPDPQEFAPPNIGNVILNTPKDPPWSKYFSCRGAGPPDYARNY